MSSPRREKDLETLAVLSAGLLVFFLIFKIKVLLTVAIAVLLIAVFVKPLARLIAWLWLKLAEVLGWINSRVLLSLVFFLVLTPMALMRKLFTRKRKSAVPSNYREKGRTYEPKDLENIW